MSRCTELMDRMLESPGELDELIKDFQQIVWSTADDEEGKAWSIMRNLAYDLDLYESDPVRRARDYSFYDSSRALKEIREAKGKLKQLKAI
ncbi:MAG TPA: hypothetical protein VMT71_02670 [Syntrophorhabdales bacterium]|nr:hypothetical protein [Syntrophorhabdales bacterium]